MQTKLRKRIRWYLMEGGGIQHFQIKLKFWHYTTNKFGSQARKHKHMKLLIDIVIKQIYLFNIVAWNYRKKIGFPVCKKENFAGIQAHRKRGKSARASPTPHHTLNEERSARFTAQPLSALAFVLHDRHDVICKPAMPWFRLRNLAPIRSKTKTNILTGSPTCFFSRFALGYKKLVHDLIGWFDCMCLRDWSR